MSTQETYQQLEAALQLADRTEHPAEVHGVIVGSIAHHLMTGNKPALLALTIGQNQEGNLAALEGAMLEVYRDTSDQLFNGDELFDLCLPDDNSSLEARTEGLASWCQGYLLGLLQGQAVSIDQLPEQGPEIARDILAISEAGPSEGESAEKDDWALAELQEYVKVGTQLIFEFIYQARAATQPQAPSQ